MRSWITCGLPLVVSAGHDPPTGHHDSSDWYLALLAGPLSFGQCQCHQIVV